MMDRKAVPVEGLEPSLALIPDDSGVEVADFQTDYFGEVAWSRLESRKILRIFQILVPEHTNKIKKGCSVQPVASLV